MLPYRGATLAAGHIPPQNRGMKPILLLAGLAGVVAATAVRDVRSLSVQSDAPYAR
ncbi:MAG: hypothetical protein RL625_893, partial [Gemmatimonadota bacterium]